MYHRSGEPRSAPGWSEGETRADPAAFARLARERVRVALTAFTPGMPFDATRYRTALAAPAAPADEPDRLFCLGWLLWLAGESGSAEPLLASAADRARDAGNAALVAEAAYWRARVGLLLRRPDALPGYEAVLRTLAGAPQATAWFVDLLWRAGRVERAEQVLKTVRGNRRVAACDETPLLETRSLLRRGESAAAESVLTEATPAGTVAQAERWLLLAWSASSEGKHPEATRRFEQARQCLYPAAALEAWRRALAGRAGPAAGDAAGDVPPALADFLRGQEHRLAGRREDATAAYRAALDGPAAPFARYALARTGEGEYAELIAARPGLFLALRCRAQATLDRFRRRTASPAECLDALKLAADVGYAGVTADHFRTLATALRQREVSVTSLNDLASAPSSEPAARRNFLRAAAEQAGRLLSPAEAATLLERWATLADDEDLRAALDRQRLRLRLLAAMAESAAERPGAGERLVALVGSLLDAPADAGSFPQAASVWTAARALASGEAVEAACGPLRDPSLPARWRPMSRALLLCEAARKGDAAAAVAWLDDAEAWHGFERPSAWVVGAVESAAAARPDHPAWARVLARWLGLWQGTVSEALAARAATGSGAAPPPGVGPAPWYLHQTSRARARADYADALACVCRALDADPTAAGTDTLRAAAPELARRAHAQALARSACPDGLAPVPAALPVDAVDLLAGLPAGLRLLHATSRADAAASAAAAAEMLAAPDLPPRLAHHLALLERRAAEFLDGEDRTAEAVAAHRRAWGWWLRLLAAGPPDGPPAGPAALLADALLGAHRRRVNALLARGAVDGARLHQEVVAELPDRAGRVSAALGEDFAGRVTRFRDELATDHLLATREAMRHAPAPEGFRADYESGLTGLRRLLSLDRDNPRLLTALLETCGDWFFDLYNAGSRAALAEQVERFTPFALQLARLVEGRPGDLAARAALAAFTKFRGFVAADAGRRAELYREALRFNPADENVRELLAELEGAAGERGA
jgi:hypothetical protein